MAYRDAEEKRELKRYLKLLNSQSLSFHGPNMIVRVKATTCKLALQCLGVQTGRRVGDKQGCVVTNGKLCRIKN